MSHFFGKKKEKKATEPTGDEGESEGLMKKEESSSKKNDSGDVVEGEEGSKPIKKGEYQVQVHVIEVRDLKSRDSNGMADPVVLVECMDKKQSTEIKKATLACIFDHLMFFDFKIESPGEMEAAKVNLTVNDANSIFKDVMIGAFELDATYIWNQKNHELYRKWVALTDTTDEHEGIQGYLKVSITIIGPGEEPPTHTEDEEEDDDISAGVMMPPTVEQEGHLLSVYVDKAEDLPKLDSFGPGIDAYVRITFGGNPPCQSRVISNRSPRFSEKLCVPVMLPAMSDKIELSVFDYDKTDKDDYAATVFVKFSEIQKRPEHYAVPRWYNLYGCPSHADDATMGKKKKYAQLMNSGRMDGTAFRGRVMMSFAEKAEDEPKMSKKGEFLFGADDKHAQEPEKADYVLRFQLYEASELPAKKDVTVKVSIGRKVVESKAVKSKNGVASWYEMPRVEDMVSTWPEDIDQVPDIFVDVHDGSKRMSYLRFKAKDLSAFNEQPQWQNLLEDPHGCLDKGDFPGFLLFSLGFGRADKAPPREDLPKPPLKKYQLRTHIYQGKNLPAADDGGTCDPYCVVRCAGARAQTAFKEKTRFPTWYQTLTMEVSLPQPLALSPDINILLFDHDQIGKDDLLGRITVDVESVTAERPPQPDWLGVYMNDPEDIEGELLCSFQLIPYDATPPPTRQPIPSLLPEVKDCTVEITLLGMRSLKRCKLLLPQYPFVEFDLGDRSDKTKILKSKKSKRPTGVDPNYAQVLKLPARIPVDPLFAPYVNVNCIDYRLMGADKPLLGAASISLEPFMPWLEHPVEKKEKKGQILGLKKKKKAEPKKENMAKSMFKLGKKSAATPKKDEYEPLMDEESAGDSPNRVQDEAAPATDGETDAAAGAGAGAGAGIEEAGGNDASPAPDAAPEDVELQDMTKDDGEDSEDDDDDTPKFLRGRWRFDDEIEDQLDKLPFDEFPIFRGQTRGASFFDKMSGGDKMKEVGKLKGLIRVIDHSAPKEGAPFNIKEFSSSKQYIVRLYVLRGINLCPMDPGGTSDPYIRVYVGNKRVVNDKDNRKMKTLNPEFRTCYELECNIPGETQVKVEVMDWDMLSGDDLIGSTTIDLENLWFCDEWRNYKMKPVECRSLWNASSSIPQGKLELWVDIIPKAEARKSPMIDITLPPLETFEMRCIVWRAKEMAIMDTITNQNDLFVTATLEGMKREGGAISIKDDTDIHWRAKDGKGSFNYRLKWDIDLPIKNARLKLQAWDKDLVGSSDAIGETTLNMQPYFKKAITKLRKGKTGLECVVSFPEDAKSKQHAMLASAKGFLAKFRDPDFPEREWISLTHPDFPGETRGKVEIQIDIMPKVEAESRPAGHGRDEPNSNPVLPEPDRFKMNFLRPDAMLMEMVGPELCAKVGLLIFCVFCGSCCMFVGPQLMVFAATLYTAP